MPVTPCVLLLDWRVARMPESPHHLSVRVYYEDTDMGGIVYHANYLKFIERARSDWVRSLGLDQRALLNDTGMVFVVRRIEADYLAPAYYDDVLDVVTTVQSVSGVRLVMSQKVQRGEKVLFQANVTVACIASNGSPARLPAQIRALTA